MKVYIADTYNNAIEEWNATTQTVTTLVSSGLWDPEGVAVDGLGNVYFTNSSNSAIEEWNATTQTVTTLVSSPGCLTRRPWRWTGQATCTSPIPATTRSRSGTPQRDGPYPGLLRAVFPGGRSGGRGRQRLHWRRT